MDSGIKLGQEISQELTALTLKLLETGKVPPEAGYSEEDKVRLYEEAYRNYNSGNYQKAIEFFRFLVLLDAAEPKYTMGVAACFHMLKEYENAAKIYTVAAMMDNDNPIPNYHAADCYIQMQQPAPAILFLELAVERAANKPEFQVLKDRAQILIGTMKERLQAMG